MSATTLPRAASGSLPSLLRFGEFVLDPQARTLFRGSESVPLGSRSFDLLVALCAQAGEVLSNQALMAAAWPGRVVDEGSVRVQIAALRKALGEAQGERRFITNVPMRGYCFVAPVTPASDSQSRDHTGPGALAALLPNDTSVPAPACPGRSTGLIGRESSVADLIERLRERRCVTLVGPGGIGKTSLARTVAAELARNEGYNIIFVELASLAAAAQVPQAVASASHVMAPDTAPLPALAAALRTGQRTLLVLDNCEHVIDGAAATAEYVLTQVPDVRVLCTSREALRIEGEWVQPLEALALPAESTATAAQALLSPAVRLFVERARTASGGFELTDAEALRVCNLCRSLDGIPLAIELAAAATGAIGLHGLVDKLGEKLSVLVHGRRTAAPRQQTLRATLDWSYHLLSAGEQSMLLALSVFAGPFTHAAARAVFDGTPDAFHVSLAGLVSKSLLKAEKADASVQYSLLMTTREYAIERLQAAGNADDVHRRHALFIHDLLAGADSNSQEGRPASTADRMQAGWIDDVRLAITWAFARDTDRSLGYSVLAKAAPLFFSLSLLSEYSELARRALEMADAPDSTVITDAADEMRLCEGLGHALWHARADSADMAAAFKRALVIADQRNETSYRMRCLWGLWLACNAAGDYAGSRALAERFGEVITSHADPAAQITHTRMMALGVHLDGDQARASHFAALLLKMPVADNQVAGTGGFQFDQRVAALTVAARVQWLLGNAEHAMQAAAEAVELAIKIDHAVSLCYAIAMGAASIAFWHGDVARARRWTHLLQQASTDHSLSFWRMFGEGYQMLLDLEEGRLAEADARLALGHCVMLKETMCTVRPSLANDFILARARRGECGWSSAELLRIAGERELAAGNIQAGVTTIQEAIEIARRQQALVWELRCCISLVRWSHIIGDASRHESALLSVLSRFKEGLTSSDVRQAVACLEEANARQDQAQEAPSERQMRDRNPIHAVVRGAATVAFLAS